MLCPLHRLAEPYSCLTIGNLGMDSHPRGQGQGDLLDLHWSIFCCCLISWKMYYTIISFWCFLGEVGQAILANSMVTWSQGREKLGNVYACLWCRGPRCLMHFPACTYTAADESTPFTMFFFDSFFWNPCSRHLSEMRLETWGWLQIAPCYEGILDTPSLHLAPFQAPLLYRTKKHPVKEKKYPNRYLLGCPPAQ